MELYEFTTMLGSSQTQERQRKEWLNTPSPIHESWYRHQQEAMQKGPKQIIAGAKTIVYSPCTRKDEPINIFENGSLDAAAKKFAELVEKNPDRKIVYTSKTRVQSNIMEDINKA